MKYPVNVKPINQVSLPNSSSSKSRLGLDFEKLLNDTNQYYQTKNIALIHKKPTPIQVTKVDFPNRQSAKITEGFYKIPSTTDYNGIYRGYYIDFEAKSCDAGAFSFTHIYQHQLVHLEMVLKLGGIAFLIIMFNKTKEVFLLPAELLLKCYQESLKGGRKSISYQYFKDHGYLITLGYRPTIDYLKAVDQYLITKEH